MFFGLFKKKSIDELLTILIKRTQSGDLKWRFDSVDDGHCYWVSKLGGFDLKLVCHIRGISILYQFWINDEYFSPSDTLSSKLMDSMLPSHHIKTVLDELLAELND